MNILEYNNNQSVENKQLCVELYSLINATLPKAESKIWYAAPVWFRDGYPLVGYFVRKSGVSLLFWSGQAFDEPNLKKEGKFKAAEKIYASVTDINKSEVKRWLKKCWKIVYDYKNIVKNKGKLDSMVAF